MVLCAAHEAPQASANWSEPKTLTSKTAPLGKNKQPSSHDERPPSHVRPCITQPLDAKYDTTVASVREIRAEFITATHLAYRLTSNFPTQTLGRRCSQPPRYRVGHTLFSVLRGLINRHCPQGITLPVIHHASLPGTHPLHLLPSQPPPQLERLPKHRRRRDLACSRRA